jgi:hypothetical protein
VAHEQAGLNGNCYPSEGFNANDVQLHLSYAALYIALFRGAVLKNFNDSDGAFRVMCRGADPLAQNDGLGNSKVQDGSDSCGISRALRQTSDDGR